MSVPFLYQLAIKGVVIVLAVAIDRLNSSTRLGWHGVGPPPGVNRG